MNAVEVLNTTQVHPPILLKIGINVLPPLIIVKRRFKNGSAIMTGYGTLVMNYLYAIPGVRMEYYPSRKGEGQTYRMPNGTWSGLGGLLKDKFLDVFGGPIIIDEETYGDFGIVHPFSYKTISIFASAQKPEATSFFTFLVNIQMSVWYCLLLSFFLLILTSAMADNTQNLTRPAVTRDVGTYFWIYVAALFCEGSDRTAKTRTSQLLQFTWLYLVMIFSNCLFSQFAAVLTVRTEGDKMHTVQDVADREDLLPITVKNSHGETTLANSPLPQYKKLYKKALEGGGLISFKDYVSMDLYQKVKDGSVALVTVREMTQCLLGTFCLRLKGNRRLYFVDEEFFMHYYSILYNKDKEPPVFEKLKRRSQNFIECGIEKHMFATCDKTYWKCEIEEDNEEIELKLSHLGSVFYLLLLCLTVSCVTFALEILAYKFGSAV